MSPRKVYLNGLFAAPENARVSVFDRGFCYGDGLFETLLAGGRNVFRLGRHLDRLFASARRIELDIPMTKGELARAIGETLRRSGEEKALVRLALSRGEQPPGLLFCPEAPPTVVISAAAFMPPPASEYENGIGVILTPAATGGDAGPQVKSANYLRQILNRALAAKQGAGEALGLDGDDRVTEGSASNVFIVSGGVVRTPPVGPSVLPGITREAVIEIARRAGLDCREEAVSRQRLAVADEVFITNTRIGVLPVTRIESAAVGDGRPGPLTRRLSALLSKTVEAEIQKC